MHRSRDDVNACAGRERNDQLDVLRGLPALRMRGQRGGCNDEDNQEFIQRI
jgi:hypothetical protein